MTFNEALDKLDKTFIGNLELKKTLTEALYMRIPRKPKYVDVRFRNHGKRISDGSSLSACYECPTCRSHIFHVFDSETHCSKCGQALDWSEAK